MSSKTIDERIVSMKFDNADFKKKAKETVKLIREFTKDTEKAWRDASKSMNSGWDSVQKSFDKFKKKLDVKKDISKVSDQISGVTNTVKKAFNKIEDTATSGWKTITNGIDKVKSGLSFSKETNKASDEFDRMASEAAKAINRMQSSTAEGFTPVIKSVDAIREHLNFSKETNKVVDDFAHAFGDMYKHTQKINFDEAANSLKKLEAASDGVTFSGMNKALDEVKVKFGLLEVAALNTMNNIVNHVRTASMQLAQAASGVQAAKDGFGEYELEIGSVQTIQASTGKDLDYIMAKLGELNDYADRTIYSFSDMTQNIGKFTNAGVDLDKAVKAIQGVSNVAAVSGANANDASRAMYNFAQALSSGSIRLIDWMSIENANMATVEFKNELIKSAVAAGTLQDNLDGTFKVLTTNASGGTLDESIDAVKGFRDSLSYNWMTADVLIDTLNRYSDATTEIGKKANEAATVIKTFTQLIDTLKEALGTGWAVSWRYIIGDFEEAKILWTAVGNTLGDYINAQADARNEMLKTWRAMKGREAVIEGIKNAFEALVSVIKPIRNAFRTVFPPMTGERLAEISEKFRDFTKSLILSEDAQKKLETLAKGLFSFVDILIHIPALLPAGGGVIGTVLGKLVAVLTEAAEKVSEAVYKMDVAMRDFIDKIPLNTFKESYEEAANSLKELTGIYEAFGGIDTSAIDDLAKRTDDSFSPIKWIFETISNLANSVKSAVETMGPYFKKVFSGIGDVVMGTGGVLQQAGKYLWDSFIHFLDSFTFEDFIRIITGMEFRALLKDIRYTGLLDKQMAKDLERLGDTIIDIGEGCIDVVNEFRDAIKLYEKQINAKILLTIASAVGILALSMTMLSQIDKDALINSLLAISGAFVILMLSTLALVKIMDSTDKMKKIVAGMGSLLILSASILMLSTAARKLGELKWEAWARGLIGASIFIAELTAVAVILSGKEKTSKYFKKRIVSNIVSLIFIAEAVAILVRSVAKLAKVEDPNKMIYASIIVLDLMAALIAMSKLLSYSKNSKASTFSASDNKSAFALVLMAEAVKMIAHAIIDIAEIKDTKKMWMSLAVIAVVMASLTAMSKLLAFKSTFDKGLIFIGISAILFAKTIQMIADAMLTISDIPQDKLWTARATLMFTIWSMAGALKLLSTGTQSLLGSIKTGFAVFGLSKAIRAIAEAMLDISKIDADKLNSTTGSMAAILGMLTVFGMVLGNMNPNIPAVAMLYLLGDLMLDLSQVMLRIKDINLDQVGIITLLFGAMVVLMGGLSLVGKQALVGALTLKMFVTPAILEMAYALNTLRGITIDDLGGMLVGLAGSLVIVTGMAMFAGEHAKASLAGALAMTILAHAMMPIANAINELAKADVGKGIQAATLLATTMILMGGAMALLGRDIKAALVGAAAFTVIGVFVNILANAITTIANMEGLIDKILPTISMFGGVMAVLIVSLTILGGMAVPALAAVGVMLAASAAMWALGKALQVLAVGLQALSVAAVPYFTLMANLMSGFLGHVVGWVKSFFEIIASLFDMHSPSKKMEEIGVNIMQGLVNGVKEHLGDIPTLFVKLVEGLFLFLFKVPGVLFNIAKTFVVGIIKGIWAKKDDFMTELGNFVNNALDWLLAKVDSFFNIGKSLMDGLVQGISGGSGGAVTAIKNATQALIQQAKNSFKINSPSKVFEDMGLGLNAGLTEGLSMDMSNIAMDGFDETISELYKSIDSGFGEPTITPVLDLTDFQSGLGDMNSMMSGTSWDLSNAARLGADAKFNANNQYMMNTDNTDVVSAINSLQGQVSDLQNSMSGMQVVMDSGALVGSIAAPMDKALYTRNVYKERRML